MALAAVEPGSVCMRLGRLASEPRLHVSFKFNAEAGPLRLWLRGQCLTNIPPLSPEPPKFSVLKTDTLLQVFQK